MSDPTVLRTRAEASASALPPLLAAAEHLASTVILGDHGRRRAGTGDTFWQYRPAQSHDSARSIDWRRSARSDGAFVQDKEWQIAQSVVFWVDQGASMRFTSDAKLPDKATVARTLTLACAILLNRGGERIGLTGAALPPRRGTAQIAQMAAMLSQDDPSDYAIPEARGMVPHSRAVFVSDFLSDLSPIEAALTRAADRGVRGALVQILDPQEEAFPFDGRTVFESMTGGLRHETLRAGDLRDRYLDRLAERKDRLTALARTTGWQFTTQHTDAPATQALLWLYAAMEQPI